MRTHPFTISVRPLPDGRYEAIARTIDGDRVAYGTTHQQALENVLTSAWTASLIK